MIISSVMAGWRAALRQPFAVLSLFVYNLAWGMVLYKLVSSIIVPLLHRYPGQDAGREAAQLFWIEGQFQISKTELLHPYLWWALGLLLARMALTPLINAGLYFSLQHTSLNAGYRFVSGIRKFGPAFLGLYALQLLLTLAPLPWALKEASSLFHSAHTYEALASGVLPLLIVYLVYGYIVHLCFTFAQFAIVSGDSPFSGVQGMLRRVVPVAVVSFLLLVAAFILTVVVVSASMIWAGFAALLLVQASRLVSMFCKVWTVASQHRIWLEHSES